MARELIYVGGQWLPAAWRTDTSVSRVFNSLADPSTFAELTLAAQDRWCQIASPTPPPPPPPGYTPRVVPAYGTYRPDDSNTGIVTPLETHEQYNYPGTSPIVVTVDGTVFTSLDIYGDITIQARNVVFQDCVFRGPRNWPSNDGAIIDCNNSACVNLLVRDSTFAPQLPNYYRNGMIGHEYTALRNRSFWINDHYGVYTKPGANLPTKVKIAGCYMTDNVYWQGTTAQYPGQAVGTSTVTTTWGASFNVVGYPLKADGSHNDGIQIQGGLGGSKSIWCIGNNIRTNDAWAEVHLNGQGHPIGWDDPIPQLGTGNSQKLRTYNSGASLNPMADGRYANNGQSFVIQQNTYQFPQVDTVVCESNWCNDGGQGFNIQAHAGGYTTVQCTVQNNRIGGNWYNFSAPSTPAIYPIRIDWRADATVVGLDTNTWSESTYGVIGSPLTDGRTSGIRYDN
jgi:hypothetical protein